MCRRPRRETPSNDPTEVLRGADEGRLSERAVAHLDQPLTQQVPVGGLRLRCRTVRLPPHGAGPLLLIREKLPQLWFPPPARRRGTCCTYSSPVPKPPSNGPFPGMLQGGDGLTPRAEVRPEVDLLHARIQVDLLGGIGKKRLWRVALAVPPRAPPGLAHQRDPSYLGAGCRWHIGCLRPLLVRGTHCHASQTGQVSGDTSGGGYRLASSQHLISKGCVEAASLVPTRSRDFIHRLAKEL